MTIVKRRKTTQYMQLNNFPVQQDLDDLAAIGLLTYIMSLPESWNLHKTFLQTKFSRRKVDGAWKLLAEKGYIVGFIAYVDRKKTYFYNVSDIKFAEDEYLEFIEETLKEILDENENAAISSLSPMPDNIYSIPDENSEKPQETQENSVPHVLYDTKSTVQNVPLLNKYKEKKYKEKNIKDKENFNCNFKEVASNDVKDSFKEKTVANEPTNNLLPDESKIESSEEIYLEKDEFRDLLINQCNSFYTQFSLGRWNKKQWNTLVEKFVSDTIISERYKTVPTNKIAGYAFKSLERICDNSDYKHSDEYKEYQEAMKEIAEQATDEPNIELPDGMYNWVLERE